MRSGFLKDTSLVVVKLGTGVLTNEQRRPDPAQMRQLVAQVAAQRRAGRDVVLVSSGAVGSGMGALGFSRRPAELAELQACAAVGQSRLMTSYQQLFGEFGLTTAQVLLTHDDLRDRDRHLNARNTLVTLLEHHVVPIINENDAVSFTEIKFGDNDTLSAMVACLLPADLLVILTTADGVVEAFGTPQARVLPTVERIDARIEQMARGTTSVTAVGGMTTKIQAARMATRSGIPVVIASGRKTTALADILDGREEGTFFTPQEGRLTGRKRWIAFFHRPKGTLHVDDGAKAALREKGRSLLPVGITRCQGDFDAGDVVRICDSDGMEFARGIARVAAGEVNAGGARKDEIVHRDDLVVL